MAQGLTFEQIQKKYLRIFLMLIVLTGLTVGASYIHLGGFLNILVGVAIAVCKALLVIAIFMHIKFDNPKLRYFIVIPVFFFITLVSTFIIFGL